jgi:glycerophosphoryl diester phosphodiesterase
MEEDVATFEEMLDASKDKIILFVELKGNTADEQMAEDAVRIIKEKGMEKQCVLISLKYPLINYIETKYPEMDTAYLTFASFGNTQNLNCDYLGLEEEAATDNMFSVIHQSGKKVMVWTPNELRSQRKFLISQADYIITDQISMANETIKELNKRKDYEVILDWVFY